MDLDMRHNSESDDLNGDPDGEGVWSPDIEQSFQEALLLYPPCGRRKTILQEECGSKMLGRNELIALHIKKRTGKERTRKQVSSHIQVLARRKAKSTFGSSSTGGVSSPQSASSSRPQSANQPDKQAGNFFDAWMDRPIVTSKIRLVEFSAFTERRPPNQSLQPPNQNPNAFANTLASNMASNLNQAPVMQQVTQMEFSATQNGNNMNTANLINGLLTTDKGLNMNEQSHLGAETFSQLHQQNNYPYATAMTNGIGQQSHMPATTTAPQLSTANGYTRHPYVRISYPQIIGRHMHNKLEQIDISQFRDKFHDEFISLYHRGPSDAFFLVKFWADLNNPEFNMEDQNSFFGFSSRFETIEAYRNITCSTKVCSYGQQVVEKVEKIYGTYNSSNGRYSFDINRSPMCEFMSLFIKKLRKVPLIQLMNRILENFTVLQVVTCEATSEILLCLAYVFEITSPEQNHGPQYHVYKLTGD